MQRTPEMPLDTPDTTELEIYTRIADISSPEHIERERQARIHRVQTESGILLVERSPNSDSASDQAVAMTASIGSIRNLLQTATCWNTPVSLHLGFSNFEDGRTGYRFDTYPSPELLANAYAIRGLTAIMGKPAPLAYLAPSGVGTEDAAFGEAHPEHWLEAQRLGFHPAALPSTQTHHHDLGTFDLHYLRTHRYHESVNALISDALTAVIHTAQRKTDHQLRSLTDVYSSHLIPLENIGNQLEESISPGQVESTSFLSRLWYIALGSYQTPIPDSVVQRIAEATDRQIHAKSLLDDYQEKHRTTALLDGIANAT